MDVKKATFPLRHKIAKSIVKLMVPTTLYSVIEKEEKIESVPRPMISFIKAYDSDTPLIGVEIGVDEGENAESIFKTLNIKHLYLIDPYEVYFEYGKPVTQHVNSERTMKATLNPFWDRITFLKLKSQDAVNMIPQVDFVYIDGCHDYEAVKKDILNYYSKVKDGGVIGGHNFDFSYLGVARAICEFAEGMDLHMQIADWWIVK